MTGLYFHIPFCAKKCPYCDFYSIPYQKSAVQAYVDALIRNVRQYGIKDPVDSIYFGGGTPSLLTPAQVAAVLDACAARFSLTKDAEITLEYNPTRKGEAYLRELHSIGVNRLSIGTQSFSDAQLQLLGRTHTAEDNRRAVQAAHGAGFVNISCDLMLATPDQTAELLAQTLEELTALPITHVSAYMLQVEEGTPLSRDTALLARCPDDDATADRYLQAVRSLAAAGLVQYEVSSFAREGFESRHNLKYWRGEPYLGIGAGAHSCFDGRRFCVPKDAAAFIAADRQPTEILDEHPLDREERLMLLLRLSKGIPETMLSPGAVQCLPQLLACGFLCHTVEGNLALTPKGFTVSNSVIVMLLQ